MLIITFLLPGGIRKSSGGLLIIFEYANRLCHDGNYVNIIEPSRRSKNNKMSVFIRQLVHYFYYSISKNYIPNWFNPHKNMKFIHTWSLAEKYIPKSDIIIATYIETAFWLAEYVMPAKKNYFIQDFENWFVSDKLVFASYKLQLKKIVVSPWLLNKVLALNEQAQLVTNGFDTKVFSIMRNIKERNKLNILTMWHQDERKRCIDVINAIKIVKNVYPEISITMFGVFRKPSNIPFHFHYVYKPSKDVLVDLYNSNSIYVAASREEGFGLTIGEAMLCGTAVVCTNNDGFSLMAINNKTALVSDVYNVEFLAANIIKLIEDDDLRYYLINNALEYISGFSINTAYQKFKSCILE